ncbi:MAG: ABC transporter permease [Chloroflexi bacterium]|nr:ABC transporter permease [Chloroflexota bacterium]
MDIVIRLLASILADSAPLVFAAVGETITEKAGVINLSLDGSLMLAAMAGFAVAYSTGSVAAGFLAAMAVGALVALLIAYAGIALNRDQVAVGFILTVLCTDLSSFLGTPFVRKPIITALPAPIPFLSDIPVLGTLFFNHSVTVYASFAVVLLAWLFMFKTQPGLMLQGIGERPAAAFARGANVNRLRYLYTLIGGALVGVAGAAFSLGASPGWSYHHTQGFGWIALSIVIFGGWHPFRAAFGAYLFGGLQTLGSVLQAGMPDMPIYVFQVAPFLMMILVLLAANSEGLDRLMAYLPAGFARWLTRMLRGQSPAALGANFHSE